MRTFRTLLEQKIWERRETFEEFVEYAETFAREHHEPGTLGVRHLQRLAAGQGPGGRPLGSVRPATARLLEHIFAVRVDELLAPPAVPDQSGPRPAGPGAVVHDHRDEPARQRVSGSDLSTSFEWLDGRAGWITDASRRKVAARVARLSPGDVLDRHVRRAKVGRSRVATALAEYYGAGAGGYQTYCPSVDERSVPTTVLSRPDWLDLACSLTPGLDRLTLADPIPRQRDVPEVGARDAVDRLAEVSVLDVRLANAPLYRLLDVEITGDAISGSVGLVPFAEYALTLDLLESELADAVLGGGSTRRGALPLRDRYLPGLSAVLNLRDRLCAGGVLGLCAIARPADPFRGPADYALVVQERSAHVLNSPRRLAVIPKGFHQPLEDVRADARIGATLWREMEEELFGRDEVDSTAGESRIAAPMHPRRLSEPMRWLTADPTRLTTECVGFGLNLVSGNYEFATLVVIEDDEFWTRFGGEVEANWEAAGLRLYSSLERRLISDLVIDEMWSNEGLFAFLQGIRRLREVGGDRVDLPAVDL
jgi:hypothetical protein